jgi:hypothetical protein
MEKHSNLENVLIKISFFQNLILSGYIYTEKYEIKKMLQKKNIHVLGLHKKRTEYYPNSENILNIKEMDARLSIFFS